MITNHVPRLLAEKFGGKEKINLKQVQQETGLSYSSIGAWAKGRVERVDFDTLEAWCDYLNVDLPELFTREKESSTHE